MSNNQQYVSLTQPIIDELVEKIKTSPRAYPKSFRYSTTRKTLRLSTLPKLIEDAKTPHRKKMLRNEYFILVGAKCKQIFMNQNLGLRMNLFKLELADHIGKNSTDPEILELTAYYYWMGKRAYDIQHSKH